MSIAANFGWSVRLNTSDGAAHKCIQFFQSFPSSFHQGEIGWRRSTKIWETHKLMEDTNLNIVDEKMKVTFAYFNIELSNVKLSKTSSSPCNFGGSPRVSSNSQHFDFFKHVLHLFSPVDFSSADSALWSVGDTVSAASNIQVQWKANLGSYVFKSKSHKRNTVALLRVNFYCPKLRRQRPLISLLQRRPHSIRLRSCVDKSFLSESRTQTNMMNRSIFQNQKLSCLGTEQSLHRTIWWRCCKKPFHLGVTISASPHIQRDKCLQFRDHSILRHVSKPFLGIPTYWRLNPLQTSPILWRFLSDSLVLSWWGRKLLRLSFPPF